MARTEPQPGDRVRMTLPDGQAFEGLLMPRHAFSGADILTLKLSSGYNVGLLATGAKVEVLEAAKPRQTPSATLSDDAAKPTIAFLGTGGTIASFIDYRTGGVSPATRPEELAAAAPELFRFCNVRAEVVFNMFSEDMQPEHWSKIAERVAWHLNNGARGVVVPHGTDTLHYTAAALAFCLKDLKGPVVLVGSQRSSDRPSSDAAQNLLAAARVAATTDLGEVAVVMHETTEDAACAIHRGVRVRKLHTSRRDAFQSVNVPPLGRVEGEAVTLDQPYRKATQGPTRSDGKWDERVSMLLSYPGLWPEHIEDVVLKATIIVGTGLGHIARRCLPGIQSVISRGAHVVMASQCIHGRVNMNVYSTGRDLLQMGVLPAEDMLPEVAYIKMMWILGHTEDPAKVRELFLTDLAGELGAVTDVRAFGQVRLPEVDI
ncbi:MAG TPA: Glu-tRNA(Gln) amidotransferase subunit GatD [Candidatus Thermoplasmatota archaeon]|nr:Glu-tRNA(Gln) amidotransferase subunit GatD [Candidatus Thermoplasmatota archaeon]